MRLRTIPLLVVIVACVAALGAWTDKPKVGMQTSQVVEAYTLSVGDRIAAHETVYSIPR